MTLLLLNIPQNLTFNNIQQYLDYVSPERKAAVMRFIPESSRIQSLLGALLSRFAIRKDLSLPNEKIKIAHTEYGKPYLTEHPDYYFSLSHSGDYIAFVSDNYPIGVDIQKVDKLEEQIAKQFFTKNEYDYVLSHGISGFYEVWTKKEAYVKLLGTGLSAPFSSFDVFDNMQVNFHTWIYPQHTLSLCCTSKVPEIPVFTKVSCSELLDPILYAR